MPSMDKYRAGLHRQAIKRRDKYLAMIRIGMSMAAIGRVEGISRERVRQVVGKK